MENFGAAAEVDSSEWSSTAASVGRSVGQSDSRRLWTSWVVSRADLGGWRRTCTQNNYPLRVKNRARRTCLSAGVSATWTLGHTDDDDDSETMTLAMEPDDYG
jgi:hypothetical protein